MTDDLFASVDGHSQIDKAPPVIAMDPERQLATIIRVWNRSDRDVRQDFLEMASEADGGLIEP